MSFPQNLYLWDAYYRLLCWNWLKFAKKICCALIFFLKKLINYGATDDQIFTKIFLVVNYYPMSLSFKFCKDPCTHARTRAITARRVNVARREKLFIFSLLCLQKSTLTPKSLGFDVSAGLINLYRMWKLGWKILDFFILWIFDTFLIYNQLFWNFSKFFLLA